ncbi:MAG: deoxyribonuclease IV, partial [Dehalococcoidia bacterium]
VKDHPQKDREAYKEKAKEAGIAPTFFHGVYLINLGSPNAELVEKGVNSLITYQVGAATIDCLGTIFHVGSHKGQGFDTVLPQVVRSLNQVLEGSPEGPWLIIENSAGMGQSIGASFVEIGRIIKAVGSHRLKVCLDTQHCFANGYDVGSQQGLDATVAELEREVGLDRLVAVHANDSKCPLEGGIDRHENIGEGHIGLKGFEVIVRHPAFQDVPFLLEVPGFDKTGPDQRNVQTLKALRRS